MGSHKTIDKSVTVEDKDTKKKKGKKKTPAAPQKQNDSVIESPSTSSEATTTPESKPEKKTKKERSRSKRYINARGQVDRTTLYAPVAAVELLKRVSRKKHATVTADLVHADAKVSADLSFPHATGKSVRVAVVDDKLLSQIEKGQIDFDVLLATPEYMPRLAKLAKVLGPKGLMPNPKNGTLTKDTAGKQKELSGGKFTVKTEKKAPLIHVQIGKTTMSDQELLDNLAALAKAVNPDKIRKLVISSSMSPGIKVDITPYQVK